MSIRRKHYFSASHPTILRHFLLLKWNSIQQLYISIQNWDRNNIGSDHYAGCRCLLSFTNVEESADIGAKSVVTLNGMPSANLSLALTEPYQGREVTILFGIRNANLCLIVIDENGDFILTEQGGLIDVSSGGFDNDASSCLFVGYIDQMDITEGVEFK